ncbi:MAG: HAD-IC family P-type ATPase [Candidatus Wildermuthbacteria bacterium]|nr:HAD-IC family P-type ATPase [Candidatus Wildermuthbacteria bacterium]
MAPSWHSLPVEEVIRLLETSITQGLTHKEAEQRKKIYGPNILGEEKPTSALFLFLSQFKNPLVLVLLVAGCVTLLLAKYTDSVVILGAMLINAFIGYIQEQKATKALSELKKIVKYGALVIRDEAEQELAQEHLVPGDIILLQEGSRVPADARIVESWELQINEAVLTGEWLASSKQIEAILEQTPVADRDTMAYMGSVVEEGGGKAVVVATGHDTEVGKIGTLLQSTAKEETPYHQKLKRLSSFIGVLVTLVAFLIFLAGVATGNNLVDMFTIAIAIAVAAIPEGLPAAMTIVLAIGMQRILKQKGLVRHIASAETLGSTSVIATDKTLTLTEGKMEVEEIVPFAKNGKEDILCTASLANRAFIENPSAVFEQWRIIGKPTDVALVRAAIGAGISKTALEQEMPLVFKIPFSSQNPYTASFHQTFQGTLQCHVAGLPETVLSLSLLSQEDRERILQKLEELAQKGLRVLALAKKELSKTPHSFQDAVSRLQFLGLIAFKDPLRKGAKEAIQKAKEAGLRVILVTGDHPATAKAVAQELGIDGKDESILVGKDLEQLSDKELDQRLPHISVFARVEPRHKLRIIEAWQGKGEVIAMTGDGVNDAPALKKADIGLALGSGTDVAKEASDIVLLGDNFSIIPAAIREGRLIIDNIRKIITYLVSGSFTETILIGGSLLAGFPLPVTALQILWINLAEDVLPGAALAFEKPQQDIMRRKPLKKHESLLTGEMKTIIFFVSVITDFLLFGLFWLLLQGEYSLSHIQTFIFVGLGLNSLFYVFSLRNLRENIWRYNPLSNLWLLGAVALGIFLLLVAVYTPFMQTLLKTVPLSLFDWALLLGLTIINIVLIEATKWIFIRREHK